MNDTPDQVLLALGRLEGKVDALMSQQSKHQVDMDSLDVRVRHLEGSKALLFGACAVLATGASYIVTLLQ